MENDQGWKRVVLGRQPALLLRAAGVRVAFGIGPRYRAGTPEERAAALVDAVGGVQAVRWCRQVHGRLVASLGHDRERTPPRAGCVGRCDALLTAEPGLLLLVWTADCVPLVLAGSGVVGAVHAGWRGIAAGVVATVVRRVEVEYGLPAAELRAFVGPAVGPCHYRVGDEVVEALSARGVDPRVWLAGDRVDLRALVAGELARCGVFSDRVELVGGCTACDPEFASYRRDGDRSGRQPSVVMLEG